MKPKVAIVDCNRNGLASIRSLGRKGVDVIAFDHSRLKPGIYSRYVDEAHMTPKPQTNTEGFVEAIKHVGQRISRDQKPALLPVNDEYVRVLAENWDRLKDDFVPLFETNIETLNKVGNKLLFAAFMEQIGIPQPKRYTEKDLQNDSLNMPIIVKPDERRSLDNLNKGVFKVRLCHDIESARSCVSELSSVGTPAIIQEFVPGGDETLVTAGVAALDGRVLGCFTGRKVRQFPPKAGQATLAESIDDPKLVEYAQRIVSALKYTGIAQIEFKKWNDELYAIEMNPRSWSWHGLAFHAGVDLPYLVYQAVVNQTEPTNVELNRTNGKTWYYFLEDLIYSKLTHRSISWREILRSSREASSYAFFDRNDALPWIVHMMVDVPLRLVQLIFRQKRKIDIE